MRAVILIFATLLLAGCASDAAIIRVIEYRADSPLSALAGSGVAVHQSGKAHSFANVEIVYEGERSTVTITSEGDHAVLDEP